MIASQHHSPQHHCDLATLLDYTAGTASDALVLAVSCHLGFCAECRSQVARIEQAAAVALAPAAAAPPPVAVRDRLLAQVANEPAPVRQPPTNQDTRLTALGLPAVLRHYLPRETNSVALKWRFLVPGAKTIDLATTTPGTAARVVCFRPGFVVPPHDHEGVEYTVVVRGHFDDAHGRFAPGDFCLREPGDRHEQRIGDDDSCIAVTVNCGPLIPLTPLGKVLKFIGRV